MSDPNPGLIDRAGQGDPAALAALQGQANFNFGRTEQAVKEFDASVKDTGLPAASQSFGTVPQYQPPGAVPKIGQTINPGQPPDLRVR